MKVAIPTAGEDLSAEVEMRFGRCPRFLVVDSETMEFEAVENTAAMMGGGAGVRAAQIVLDQGVDAVIAGDVGPRAFDVLQRAGVKVYARITGNIKDAMEMLKTDMAERVDGPTGPALHGR